MTLPGSTGSRVGWITLAVTIAMILIRTIVVAVQTQRDVEQLRTEVVVLREEIRIVHEDIKSLLNSR